MKITQSDYNSLQALPCFKTIVELELLTDGMSHICVKVSTPGQSYLAKKLNLATAMTEVYASLTCASKGLSPRVIYHTEEWLITEFITGTTLGRSTIKSSEKISIALSLMAELHQLPSSKIKQSIPTLDTTQSINCLLMNPASFSRQTRLKLVNITKYLTGKINAQIAIGKASSVVCHGDINFTNILIGAFIESVGKNSNTDRNANKKQKPWLIDFECTHLAPVEFDLAMFIAVNNISAQQLSEIVNNYSTFAPSYQVDNKLLIYYILYSYFINGLWYLDNITDSKTDNAVLSLAIEQWSAFDCFAVKHSIKLERLTTLYQFH